MTFEADLRAVVYDPPAPGLPHLAVLFGRADDVLLMASVDSIEAGEAFLEAALTDVTGADAPIFKVLETGSRLRAVTELR